MTDEEKKERNRERGREYYRNNRDKVLARTRKYKEEHREDYIEQSRRYAKEHPEQVRTSIKRWAENNPEKMREYSRNYYSRHPDRVKAKSKAWYEKNDMTPKRQEQKFRARLKRFGLSLEAYQTLWEKQGKHCAICPATKPKREEHSRLHIDHDHKTGAVRGILCGDCNSLLGYAGDNISRLQSAIEFLKNVGDYRDIDPSEKLDRRRKGLGKDNTSGYPGVSWKKENGAWQAAIRVDGKVYYLGLFEDVKLAAKAYREADAHRMRGEPILSQKRDPHRRSSKVNVSGK